MKIDYVTYKGVGELNEDALIINEKLSLYGVADGVSSLVPFKNHENLTGGYIASHDVKNYFETLEKYSNLYDDFLTINKKIQTKMIGYHIDMLKKEQLWGTALAVVKISESGIDFIQTGDCMILAVYRDGTVRPLTQLQVEHLENKALTRWEELIQQGVKSQKELMKYVKDILVSNRKKSNSPNGYGVLNGEDQAIDYSEYGKINNIGLNHLILITDGMLLPKGSTPEGTNYWNYIATSILNMGIKQYARDLLKLEETDPQCVKYPRFKKSDDKAGVVITLED